MIARKTLGLGIACVAGLSLLQCDRADSQPPGGDPAGQAPAAKPAAPAQPAAVRFKTVTCVDKDGIGLEAFRLIAPDDWVPEGGIRWVLDNPLLPAVVDFRCRAPKGRDAVQVHPNLAFFWSNNPTVMALHPPGRKYFGSEVRKPVEAVAALKTLVIPRRRAGVAGLQVVSAAPLPDLAKHAAAAAPHLNLPISAAKVRVAYARDGVAMEEEFYAVVEGFSYPVQTMGGRVTHMNWFVDYVVSFQAEKGRLDARAKTFQAIVRSFKVNPQWFNKYGQLVEMLIRQKTQQIRKIGEVGRMIARTSSEISEQRMKDWTARQAVNDRIVDDFCRGIRGVELYHNPYENKPVELPSGYENAWVNRTGDYILSESPSYNPNIGSNLEWRRIERTR
jgi:hypothetical protein